MSVYVADTRPLVQVCLCGTMSTQQARGRQGILLSYIGLPCITRGELISP